MKICKNKLVKEFTKWSQSIELVEGHWLSLELSFVPYEKHVLINLQTSKSYTYSLSPQSFDYYCLYDKENCADTFKIENIYWDRLKENLKQKTIYETEINTKGDIWEFVSVNKYEEVLNLIKKQITTILGVNYD